MKHRIMLLLTLLLLIGNLEAVKPPFSTTLEVNILATSKRFEFLTAPRLVDFFKIIQQEETLIDLGLELLTRIDFETLFENSINGFQKGHDDLKLSIDFRGIPIVISYPDVLGTTLLFEIAAAGIRETFQGADREESFSLFKDFIDSFNSKMLNRILKAGAKQSPIDPIAGNPGSLMTKMVVGDFDFCRQNIQYRPSVHTNCLRRNCFTITGEYDHYYLALFAEKLVNKNFLPAGLSKSGAAILSFDDDIAFGKGNVMETLHPDNL